MLSRRVFLGAGGAAVVALAMPQMAFARANTSRRFVFIIQRGAADGLSTLGPTGDPQHAGLRGDFDQDLQSGTKLGSFFTLHPSLAETAKMYAANQALFVHAVASPYRDRSHFDGQNVLETGGTAAYQLRDGWMNRLLALLPQSEARAIAVSATVPVALRGARDVSSYAPSALPAASEDLLARVGDLYSADRQLAPLWSEAMQTRKLTGDLTADGGRNAAATGALAARLLSGPQGDRIAFIETGGWDTHSGQKGRLMGQLRGLDAMLAALKTGLGPAWSDTLVLVATEFGRTAAPNGTGGTDHGTASTALLLGGALKPGGIVGDWPTLKPSALFENRDLAPTLDMRGLFKGLLAEHLGVERAALDTKVFPDSAGVRPVAGLV